MELNTQWRYTPTAKVKVCTFSTSDLISFTLFGKYLAKTICLNMMRRGKGVIVSKVEIICRINYIWFNSTLSCCFANSNELSLMRVSAFLYHCKSGFIFYEYSCCFVRYYWVRSCTSSTNWGSTFSCLLSIHSLLCDWLQLLLIEWILYVYCFLSESIYWFVSESIYWFVSKSIYWFVSKSIYWFVCICCWLSTFISYWVSTFIGLRLSEIIALWPGAFDANWVSRFIAY